MINTLTKICSDKNCTRRNIHLSLEEFYKFKEGRLGRRAICKECYHKRYAKTIQNSIQKRNYLFDNMLNNLTEVETENIFESFDNKCALTNVEGEIHLDHFVPLSWGKIAVDKNIGGTTFKNMLPLKSKINISKSDHNPFQWIKEACETHSIEKDRWEEVVNYMASKNQMTPVAYENAVSTCYEEVFVRRSIKSIHSATTRNGKISLHFIKQLFQKGINVEIAVSKYGNKTTKNLFRTKEVLEYISKVKKELTVNT